MVADLNLKSYIYYTFWTKLTRTEIPYLKHSKGHPIFSFFKKKKKTPSNSLLKKKTRSNYPISTFVTVPPLIITTPWIGFISLLNPTNDSHFNYIWFYDNLFGTKFSPFNNDYLVGSWILNFQLNFKFFDKQE